MLAKRSQELEILDGPTDSYTQAEYSACMKKLFQVNCWFGFFRDLKKILAKQPQNVSVLDVGCGSGLCLIHLKKAFPQMRMIGIDISHQAITLANELAKERGIEDIIFQTHTIDTFIAENADVIISTLVCHHIDDQGLVSFFKKIYQHADRLIVIHDLHRHSLSYFLYKLLSPMLFRNKLITHDGLISIKRGFKKQELQALLAQANITQYTLTWKFPFRWQLLITK